MDEKKRKIPKATTLYSIFLKIKDTSFWNGQDIRFIFQDRTDGKTSTHNPNLKKFTIQSNIV